MLAELGNASLMRVEDQDKIFLDGMNHAELGYDEDACPWDGGLRKHIWLAGFRSFRNLQDDSLEEED